jgi:hypothetical protein
LTKRLFQSHIMRNCFRRIIATVVMCFVMNVADAGTNYLFTLISPSGQSLYYDTIHGAARLVAPNISAGACSWQNYVKPTGKVIIPDSVLYNNVKYPVKYIGSAAFADCQYVDTIVIPETVVNISWIAFGGCTYLKTINIGSNVNFISNWAFEQCNHLNRVNYNGTINQWCMIKFIDEQSNPIHQAKRLFINDTIVTRIDISDSVMLINDYAFYNDTAIVSVSLGNNVHLIGNKSFAYCSKLHNITIPVGVDTIGKGCFSGCIQLDSISINDPNPPVLIREDNGTLSTFANNPSNQKIYVPCGSDLTYMNDTNWGVYSSRIFERPIDFEVYTFITDSVEGTIAIIQQGGNDVTCDSSCIIYAVPNFGYYFDHWSNGNTSNPDTLHLVGDSTVTAFFAKNKHTFTLNCNDSSMGTLMGSGEYRYCDTVYFVARPNPHHYVYIAHSSIYSTVDGSQYYYQWFGDYINDTMWFVMPNEDISIDVQFRIDNHSVTLMVNDENAGTVSGNGNFDYGTPAILIAAPFEGYHFVRWSNGNSNNPYAITVTQDTTLMAFFEPDSNSDIQIPVSNEIIVAHFPGSILVDCLSGEDVQLLDIDGHILDTRSGKDKTIRFDIPSSGIYFIKVRGMAAKKVVVIK